MEALLKSEEVKHSKLGASAAERWMNCPGSPQLIAKLPEEMVRRSGSAAALGTASHTVSAVCLEKGIDAWELSGEKVESRDWTFVVDEEMVNSTQMYIDYVRQRFEQFKDKGAKLYLEKPLSTVCDPDGFGTGDAIIYVPGDRIIVMDFKNGMIIVEPSSAQLKDYAAMAIEEFLDEDDACKIVELVIVQPRMPHPKGFIRKLVMSVQEVTDWFQNECLPAMKATREPNALLHVGDWCRFCPARDGCPALKGEVTSFNSSADPVALTDEEVGIFLSKGKSIAGYLAALEEEALKRVRMGKKVIGWKLVKKKGNRIFKDFINEQEEGKPAVTIKFEDAVVAVFGKDAYTEPAIKTPPNIEKLKGGKPFVSRWAYTPDTGETLAPESDKREEIKPMMDKLDAAQAQEGTTI